MSKLIQGRMAEVGRLSENAKVPSILASGALLLIRDKKTLFLRVLLDLQQKAYLQIDGTIVFDILEC